MARPVRPFLSLRRMAWLPVAWLPATPALAALPELLQSPAVTTTAGLATMLGLGGGAYLLKLRRRLSSLQAALDTARADDAGPEPATDARDRYFRLAAESGHCLEGWVDMDGRLYWINQVVERYTGYRADEVLARGFVDLVVYDRDRAYCRERVHETLSGGPPVDFELRLVGAAGNVHWMACHWQPICDADGVQLGLRFTMTDIQARKEAEYKLLETVAALRRAQALSEHYLRRSNEERSRLSALLDVVRMGILFMDTDRRVVYCNRALYEIWGMPEGDSFVGVRDVVLQQYVLKFLDDGAGYLRHVAEVVQCREPSEPHEFHFKDGRVVTDFSRVVAGPDGNRAIGRIWVFEDITEQRRVARQLLHLAERDPLTNLFNRRRFHEELERMLADGRRHREGVGLLAIDLDGFKPVNDRFGHPAGDEVLVGLAAAVGAVVRRNEMFFRMGGDEFAILVPSAAAQGLSELARRVCACIAGLRFSFESDTASVSASIGIALSTRNGDDTEALIGAADRAMYLAKALGGNCWEFARESSRMAVD